MSLDHPDPLAPFLEALAAECIVQHVDPMVGFKLCLGIICRLRGEAAAKEFSDAIIAKMRAAEDAEERGRKA